MVAAMHSTVPVINAGDGGHNHPTQTLTDLLTIRREKRQPGQLDHRPVRRPQVRPHRPLAHRAPFPASTGIKFVLISPEELKLPSYIKKDVLQKKGIEYSAGAQTWTRSCPSWTSST